MALKICDITIDDIKEKTIWQVINCDSQNWLEWHIKKIHRIDASNIIVHSAICVDDCMVYPTVLTKYYEDGGEIGEIAIHDGIRWINANEAVFVGKMSRAFLSYISKSDIHEYQKGIMDNRKWHYRQFNHYKSQLGDKNLIKYIEPDTEIPQYVFKGTPKENYAFLVKLSIEFKELSKANKISMANKKISKLIKIVKFLKQNPKNHPMLESLLHSNNPIVVQMMQYQLVDLFEETCLCLIAEKAKEDSIDGMGAKFWLKDYLFKNSTPQNTN